MLLNSCCNVTLTTDLTPQKILCWRSGPGAHAGGDVALLDPLSHRFVAAYPGLSGVVDLSGCLLAPWGALETEGPSMPTVQQRLERLRGPVRLLHGGDAAKVIQLDAEGAAWTVSSSTAASARCTPTARDVAASKVQRAWKARRDRRNKRLAAWKNSVLQPYVPATPNGGAMSPTVRDIATGETAGAEFSSSPSTVRKSRGRSAVLRDEHADGEGFSILDSLDALDAADRVLQLSAQSGDSSVASGARREAKAEMWQDRSRQGTSASESGASSGSGSEGGKALLRATDALIRQTLPVLRRTRSLQAFALSPRAHPEDGTPASTPAALDDARGQGAHITAAIEAEAKRAAAAAEEFFGPSRDTEAAEVVGTLEDGERKWEDALTSHASSPSRSPSPGQREEVSTVSNLQVQLPSIFSALRSCCHCASIVLFQFRVSLSLLWCSKFVVGREVESEAASSVGTKHDKKCLESRAGDRRVVTVSIENGVSIINANCRSCAVLGHAPPSPSRSACLCPLPYSSNLATLPFSDL